MLEPGRGIRIIRSVKALRNSEADLQMTAMTGVRVGDLDPQDPIGLSRLWPIYIYIVCITGKAQCSKLIFSAVGPPKSCIQVSSPGENRVGQSAFYFLLKGTII